MKYLVTSRKAVVLDGVVRRPGDLVEDPSNAAQLIRRGLAVPFGAETEQAPALSPSSEPAQTPSGEEGVEGEAESLTSEESSSDGEDSSDTTAADGEATEDTDDESEVLEEQVAEEEESESSTDSSAAAEEVEAEK